MNHSLDLIISLLLPTFWIAFGVSMLFAYPVYQLLLTIRVRQTVSPYLGEGHQKKQGTPTMGGLIILPGLLVALWYHRQLTGLGLVLAFALIGFIDDFLVPRLMPGKRGLGWSQKLILQFVAAIYFLTNLVALGKANHTSFFDALQTHFGTILFYSIILLAYVNAFNFADGLDALAGGLLMILVVGLAVLAAFFGQSSVAVVLACAAMGGAVVPFLFFNAPPARVFMGDVGSLPLGALLGLSFVWAIHMGRSVQLPSLYLLAIFIMSFLLFVELVLVPVQIGCVKVFKKRLPIRTPIHHTFEYWEWPESRIIWLFLLIQGLLCALALTIVWSGALTRI